MQWDAVIVLPHKVVKGSRDSGWIAKAMIWLGLDEEAKRAKKKLKKQAKKQAAGEEWQDPEENVEKEIDADGDDDAEEGSSNDAMFRRLVSRLAASGLEYASYYSVQGDEIYVKIRCPEQRLLEQADAINFTTRLAEDRLREVMEMGFPSCGIGPIQIGTECNGEPISSFQPNEYIYAKYDTKEELSNLYAKAVGSNSPFGSMQRIKLLSNILQSSRRIGGCDIPIAKRIAQGKLLAFMPLHEPIERTALQRNWMRASVLNLPFDDLKSYFGEALALYTRFLGFLTCSLLVLGIPGVLINVILWIVGYNHGPASGVLRAIYAIGLVVWSPLFLAMWHRTQQVSALQWGMTNFETSEPPRPQYKGSIIKSPVDGKKEVYFPPTKRRGRVARGSIISVLIVLVDFVFVFALMRWRIVGGNSTLIAFVQAIGIQVFAYSYKMIAIRLTSAENWRSETQFSDALTQKLFAFNFVNSYFSLLVVVFSDSKKVCGGTDSDNCLALLELNLLIIFLTALVTNSFVSVGIPILTRYYNQYREGGFATELSVAEWQYLLVEYDETLDSINAYMAVSIQLGYVLLFSSGSPIIGLLAALSNMVLLKLEIFKYLIAYRRIEPRGAEDIGKFEGILNILSLCGPISNAAIVVNHSRPFESLHPLALRRYVFVISAACAIVLQLLLRSVTGEDDSEVELQLQRQDFIRDKVINKVADEEERVAVQAGEVKTEIARKDATDTYVPKLRIVMEGASGEQVKAGCSL